MQRVIQPVGVLFAVPQDDLELSGHSAVPPRGSNHRACVGTRGKPVANDARSRGTVAGMCVPWSPPCPGGGSRHVCGLPETLSYMQGGEGVRSDAGATASTGDGRQNDALLCCDLRHPCLGKYFKGRHGDFCMLHTDAALEPRRRAPTCAIVGMRASPLTGVKAMTPAESSAPVTGGFACPYSTCDFEPVEELRLLYPFD